MRLPSTIGTPGPAAALYSILAPTSAGIVSVSSLVTYIDPAIDSPIEAASYSHTSVIRTLFERLVEPLILHHPLAGHTQGILLYGPPGTGKTYSLSALKDMSRDVCSITINNLPLTQLLSMDVKEAFKTISALFNEATDSPLPASTKAAQAIDAPCTAKTVVRTPQVYSGRKSLSPMAPMERFAHGADAFLTPGKRSTSAPATQMKPSPPLSFAARPELSVILLDEVDALGSGVNDSASQALIKRYICSWWNSSVHTTHRPCCLIATSNRPSAVDPALRRGGRLELELQVTPAAASAQSDRKILLKSSIERIVEALRTADVCSDDICVDNIAEAVAISTGGFVAADLLALSRDVLQEVLLSSGKGDSSNACRVGTENLIFRYSEVSRRITPASLRGVTLRLPQLSMDDVIGLDDTKRSLLRLLSFYNPAKRELIRRFKLTSPGGALLYGPPGNSKTRLVLACASSLRLPVISLSVADIYSPYVGDAEAEVRRAFSLARASAPCILFFDEIDAVVTDRTMEGAAGGAETRVLATLLTEIDGLSSNSGEQDIIVLGATNRLESIDSALLRKVSPSFSSFCYKYTIFYYQT